MKDKNENLLTRARTREEKMEENSSGSHSPRVFRTFKIEVQQIIRFLCMQTTSLRVKRPTTHQTVYPQAQQMRYLPPERMGSAQKKINSRSKQKMAQSIAILKE